MARIMPSAKAAARQQYSEAKSKPLGEGSRFKAVEAEAAASGAKNPAAVAAVMGRKAHGQKAMTAYSKMGRK